MKRVPRRGKSKHRWKSLNAQTVFSLLSSFPFLPSSVFPFFFPSFLGHISKVAFGAHVFARTLEHFCVPHRLQAFDRLSVYLPPIPQ